MVGTNLCISNIPYCSTWDWGARARSL